MRRTGFTPYGSFILVLAIGLVTAGISGVCAAADTPERVTVAGLGSFHAVVSTTMPNGSARGEALYADLQTAVEDRLRRAGIPVDASFTARFVVFVDIFGEDDRIGCRATIDVGIGEFALEPSTMPRAEAPRMDTHRALGAACADIEEVVRDDATALVERFISVYLEPTPGATAGIAPSHP